MPRTPENNPTERIGRILAEITELETLYDQLIETLALSHPAIFETLGAKPPLTAINQERTRQHLIGKKTITQRLAMRRTRMRPERARGSGLTPEKEAEILAEIENSNKEPSAPSQNE